MTFIRVLQPGKVLFCRLVKKNRILGSGVNTLLGVEGVEDGFGFVRAASDIAGSSFICLCNRYGLV